MAVIAAPPPPPPAAVSAALTEASVRVSSDFRGAHIIVYGAVFDPAARPTDVVVIVRGPDQPVRIARKSRVAGLWLNGRPVVFQGAPGFYMAASTRPLEKIAGFSELRMQGAGLDHLSIAAPAEQRIETRYGVRDMVVSSLGADYLDWRDAVLRLKKKAGLYADDSTGIQWVDRGLFRADIDLPVEAPIGAYDARILLFQDGRLVAVRERSLKVEKVGLERTVYVVAHGHPWFYGLFTVLLGLGAGWAASAVFRRS
jgi:uncharacterized protein (TIGR02186 family)